MLTFAFAVLADSSGLSGTVGNMVSLHIAVPARSLDNLRLRAIGLHMAVQSC